MGVARQDRADRERELMRAMAINKLKGTDLRRSKPGMIGDGGGLWLQTTPAKHGAAWAGRGFSATSAPASWDRWASAAWSPSTFGGVWRMPPTDETFDARYGRWWSLPARSGRIQE
jgi:hypothetical protein